MAGLLAVLAVAVHLWGLYRVTGPPSVPWFAYADKVEHLVGFGLPTFLVLLTVNLYARERGRAPAGRVEALVVAVFAAHAVVSEVIQGTFYTTRSGDPLDALADWVGVALGLLAYRLVVSRLLGTPVPPARVRGGARGRA